MRSSQLARARALATCLVILATATAPQAAVAEDLSPFGDGIVEREPQVTPNALGTPGYDGLTFADPTEGLVLVAPPEANNQGTAELSYPIEIPAGRGGFQPDLSLAYSSSGGNGWLGVGWDLSVGSVEVDTTWGVPRYLAGSETESYLLDGEHLYPNQFQNQTPRVANRADFIRRVETEGELITRHGTNPTNYWWEVRDKSGGVRWYGGKPDLGGPTGFRPAVENPLDESAVLRDGNDNIFRWGLTAQRDIGVNLITYSYEKAAGARVGVNKEAVGSQLYLKSIRYTASPIDPTGPAKDDTAAYEIRLLRDAQVAGSTPRPDVIVDARGGFIQTTSDLLRRVEVYHGRLVAGARIYDQLSKRYDLTYATKPFAKSLLTDVRQVGTDGIEFARTVFDYYDEVSTATAYNGFAAAKDWTTQDDHLGYDLLRAAPVGVSALGASVTNSIDGGAYIGFNPTNPTKNGSFGGAIRIFGGATESLAEFIDINGDLLPDKVFRQGHSGPVVYRLNTSNPSDPIDQAVSFAGGDPVAVLGDLKKLSSEFDIGISGGPEAYFGVFVQFNIAGDVSVGEDYFTDVNNDGLPDFVSAGTVYFNHLVPSGGARVPSFSTSSDGTAVPIVPSPVGTLNIQALQDAEDRTRASSPLQDTVRRWIAPFAGTISITAPATFNPPGPAASYGGDGVRLAIQRGNQELWHASLVTPGASVTPSGVTGISVAKGQAIYFRVQSIDDGAGDEVLWNPTITYASFSSGSATPPADVNGLTQKVFVAKTDFTLAGRPGTIAMLPLKGTVRFDAVLAKTAVTTDDITVLVLKNGAAVLSQTIGRATIDPAIPLTTTFPAAAPTATTQDQVEVRLIVDSPIDISAISWAPRLYYTAAEVTVGGVTSSLPVLDAHGQRTIEVDVPWHLDLYPNTTLTAPSTPWTASTSESVTVRAKIDVASGDPAALSGQVFLTVKQRGSRLAKTSISITGAGHFEGEVTVSVANGQDYWFDLSVRDTRTSERITGSSVELENAAHDITDVPSTRYWQGGQGIFPIGYRGWGIAGYNGDGARAAAPIDPSAFDIDVDALPKTESDAQSHEPTDFDGPNPASDSRAYAYVPQRLKVVAADGTILDRIPVWRGMKDNLAGGADFQRSSRTGADSVSLTQGAGTGATAVRRVGVSAPIFSLAGGVGPLSGSFGTGPSFGLLDYIDMNGDGFPDVVAPGYIEYSDPRGSRPNTAGEKTYRGDGVPVVSQDVSFALSGGFGGSPVEIKGNSQGQVAAAQNTQTNSGKGQAQSAGSSSASTGDTASGDQYGVSVGLSFGASATWVNPTTTDPNFDSTLNKISGRTAPLEIELSDINGDGLPDRVIGSPQGVFVQLNLGYGFDSQEILWATGAFEANESYSGNIGPALGFTTPNKEFSGGIAWNESFDMSRYLWVDVDGDGILDQIRKNPADGSILVGFGTGAGVTAEKSYGDFAEGTFPLIGDIPTGQQVAQGSSSGTGGGFDFTIGIGPLCLPTPLCYLIINPGVHYDHSLSNSQIQLTDVNGDGYPDSVKSTSDGTMSVRLNKRGKTNLLRSVTNPLGGIIRMDYQRDGNTVDQPYSQWALASLEVDDARPGDGPNPTGPDIALTTFAYEGNRYDPLLREVLGYSKVTEVERAFVAPGLPGHDGRLDNDPILRKTVRTYRNGTVFESGLQMTEALLSPADVKLKSATFTWSFIDLTTGAAADLGPSTTDPAGLRFLTMAVQPLRMSAQNFWHDAAGAVAQETRTNYAYDGLANVTQIEDLGETETPADDVITTITYSNCDLSSTLDPVLFPCPAPAPSGRISALWNPGVCPTWTSIPAIIEITNRAGDLLRKRDGRQSLCDNSSMTLTQEWYGPGADESVETTLDYDNWGSYNTISYPDADPSNAVDERYTVDYVYDADSNTNIAMTTDSHGLVSTAKYDPITGRIAEQVDPNGQKTTYTYDAAGRLKTIVGPMEQGTSNATISFDYFPTALNYAYAIAHHFDVQHPTDPIDTVSFVDGTGRETQQKQDSQVFVDEATIGGAAVMVVSGAVEFDALGRAVKEWFPTKEPIGTPGTYNYGTPPGLPPTAMSWRLDDLNLTVVLPDGATTTTAYGFGAEPRTGATMFKTTVTDPTGKVELTYADVHERILAVDDRADPTDPLVTTYAYDPLGQLVAATDAAANVTTHTYDLLGRRTSSETPDGGLIETTYDDAGNAIAEIDPILRGLGKQTTYAYDFDWLVGIDYPDATPDVTYTYGDPLAAGNGAGRLIRIEDGAKDQELTYDALGNIATETTLVKVHNVRTHVPENTYVTAFEYDGFGRLLTLTYPDGEVLAHEYDSGGQLARVSGTKAGFSYAYLHRLEYDEFGDKAFQLTGNGVRTRYAYDPKTRWLANQLSISPEREIQDLNYTYDLVGNVKTFNNDVPAPVSNLMLGPSAQTYRYDAHYRIEHSDGTYSFAPGKTRKYTYDVTYDRNGNVTSKKQVDEVFGPSSTGTTTGGKKAGGNGNGNGNGNGGNGNSAGSAGSGSGIQAATTYDLTPVTYSSTRPHQMTKAGGVTFQHDANGQLKKTIGPDNKVDRTYTWDLAGRVRVIKQQGATTDYAYDDLGRLVIERGPSGETSFVNQWTTKINGGKLWKTIWAGEDRLSEQLADLDSDGDGIYDLETTRYFFHKDLQGSTNVVTDNAGLVFQHVEYFPSGETWVHENSNVHNTPYLFTGVYYDEARKLLNLGERWYSTREGYVLSPDPLLVEQPLETVGRPAMLQAYTYAESNPLRFVDREGRATTSSRSAFSSPLKLIKGIPRPVNNPQLSPRQAAQNRQIDVAKARSRARNGKGPALWKVRLATTDRGTKLQAFSDRFEAKPLLKINLVGGPDGWKLKDIRVKPFFSSIPKFKKQWDFDGYSQKTAAANNVAGSTLATNGAAANTGGTAQATAAQSSATTGPPASTPANAPGGTPSNPSQTTTGAGGKGAGPPAAGPGSSGPGAATTKTSVPANSADSN